MATLLVLRERAPGETRVAATPETVKRWAASGHRVIVESGCGAGAMLADQEYSAVGAEVVEAVGAIAKSTDIVVSVAPPTELAVKPEMLREGAVWVSFFEPDRNEGLVRSLQAAGISSLAMELVPRISRAQSMDALSSQANLAGYRAVLMGATRIPRFFPLLMTAAGTIRPASVVILGAGVAGLQAIATAKRLGAVVEVSDIRPEVEEQVQSLGAKFIALPDMGDGSGEGGYARELTEEFLKKQRAIVHERLVKADVVVTTALVPGRPAPKLISAETVRAMKPGAVIVDMAAARGGNCELTRADEEVRVGDVTVLGPSNIPAGMPVDASALYARNVAALLGLVLNDEGYNLDFDDEIIAGAALTHAGEVVHGRTREGLGIEASGHAATTPAKTSEQATNNAAEA